MKHSFCAEYQNCIIRPVRHEDIEFFRKWRNNGELCRYLSPVGEITSDMQEKWYQANLEDPDILTFTVEETSRFHRAIGSTSLYHFEGNTAEIGKSIIGDDEARGKSLGFYSEMMAIWIGFEMLHLSKIVAAIHEENMASLKRGARLGYIKSGAHPAFDGKQEYEFFVEKEGFRKLHPYLDDVHLFKIK